LFSLPENRLASAHELFAGHFMGPAISGIASWTMQLLEQNFPWLSVQTTGDIQFIPFIRRSRSIGHARSAAW
jgi:hypothetical protein